MWGRLTEILRGKPQVDPGVLIALEEALLTADVGVSLTNRLLEKGPRAREERRRRYSRERPATI